MRRFLSGSHVLLLLSVLLCIALGLLTYFLSGLLIFGGRVFVDYERPVEAICNDWYRTEVFKQTDPALIPTCDKAVQHPRRNQMLETEEGLHVRLVIPELPEASAVWLHVHGITDSYLNGMRFLDLARRQGFQLALLELQNHGGSDRHSQGSSWGCREKFDLLAALQYIRKQWPEKPILLSGTSMGTMTITQAVLTRPEAFTSVRGIIYESPLSSLDNISDRICSVASQGICPFLLKSLIPFLTPLRTNVDFQRCFRDDSTPTEIPTELWLSRDEFKTPEQISFASQMPAHKNLSIQIFAHGSHSAYYSYAPRDIEKALIKFWGRVVTAPVP